MINIVIVCWNAINYTQNTLDSLIKTIKNGLKVQVTIIDNGSQDGTFEYLQYFAKENSYININILKNPTNIGIGAAYNQGLQESIRINARYTVFCNNDLLFINDWILKMKSIMDNHPNVAMLVPIVPSAYNYYDNRRSIREVLLKLPNCSTPEMEIQEFIYPCTKVENFSKRVCEINNAKYKSALI